MKTTAFYITLSIFALSLTTASADWPQYLGPDRNGVYPEDVETADSWPEDGPEELWSHTIGDGFAGAAIRDGEVFILDRLDGRLDVLRCYDLESGEELWNWQNESPGEVDYNGSRAVPTVTEDRVYAIGVMGDVYCIDRESHEPVWTRSLMQDFGVEEAPMWGYPRSPLLYKDYMITSPQSESCGMVAYNKSTGEIEWQTERLSPGAGYSSAKLVNIDGVDQLVLVTTKEEPEEDEELEFEGGGVYGIHPDNGDILWNYGNFYCGITIPPVTELGGGKLFVTGGYGAGSAIIQISKDGDQFNVEELFTTKEYGAQIHPALLYKDHLYINSNGNELRNGLMCVTIDGKEKWRTGVRPNFQRGGLIVVDDKIYIVEGDRGDLFLVEPSPEEYKELARVKMLERRQVWAPLAYTDGKLVIRDWTHIKCVNVK